MLLSVICYNHPQPTLLISMALGSPVSGMTDPQLPIELAVRNTM